uniref:Scaffold protein Nfu/NifU N-terminal domain-containing protein n=1 Tax=Coccolithus braarudii TaxID=221442 RepID=A0A7S0L6L9_9EUKA|mmetsp:Transcript_22161/g.47867  ORF Transcript_22161/g.47867 Transcript_22161/m.47867 type:complete len:242 (+) Transcript_22161:65-790(+)
MLRGPRLVRSAGARRPWQQYVRGMFIQTESTPNPDSLKFLPGKSVLAEGTRDFRSLRESQVSPLARKLFQTEGVVGVYLASEFVTVSKDTDADWLTLKPQVFASIMDFYATGEPVLSEGGDAEVDSLVITDDDSEVVQMIKELLEMRIRPSVQEDGGDIVYKGFNEDDGIVWLQMQGSCAGCPSSSVTLKAGIENMLMHYIPEVREVKAIDNEDDDMEEGFDEPTIVPRPKYPPPPLGSSP